MEDRPWYDSVEVISSCIEVDADNVVSKKKDISVCDCVSKSGKPTCVDERCVNYATLIECVKCNDSCQNQNIQRGKSAKLDVLRMGDKGFGLFTKEDLAKNQYVGEYVGELISEAELTRRLQDTAGEQHLYMMQLKTNSYLDGRCKSSMMRHINHSCDPNCIVQVWTVKNRYRVGVFTIKAISADTELTFDYGWKLSSRRPTKCLCGTSKCRGYLEVMSEAELGLVKAEEEEEAAAASIRRGQWMNKRDALVYLEKLLSPASPSAAAAAEATATGDGNTTVTEVAAEMEVEDEAKVEPASSVVASPGLSLLQQQRVAAALVGKRLKIWWEGNLSFFEVDVVSYDSKSRKHLLCYLGDGDQENVYLFDPKTNWMFLNESVQAAFIQKRARADTDFGFLKKMVEDNSEGETEGAGDRDRLNELSRAPTPTAVPGGTGFDASARPRRLCKYFASPGGCSYGAACTFSHGPVDPVPDAAAAGPPPPPPPPPPPCTQVLVPISLLNTIYYYGANARTHGWTYISSSHLQSVLGPESWCQMISMDQSYAGGSSRSTGVGGSLSVPHTTMPSTEPHSACQVVLSRVCSWFAGMMKFNVKVISITLAETAPGSVLRLFSECDAFPTLCKLHVTGKPPELDAFSAFLEPLTVAHRDAYRALREAIRLESLRRESAALTVDWRFHSSLTLHLGGANASADSLFQLRRVATEEEGGTSSAPATAAAVMRNFTKAAGVTAAVTKGYFKGSADRVTPRVEESVCIGFACSRGTVLGLASKLCGALTSDKLELVVRANAAPAVLTHCLSLLYRLLSLGDASAVTNPVPVLAAIIVIATKVRGEFKAKYLGSIIAAVHERVFGRTIGTVIAPAGHAPVPMSVSVSSEAASAAAAGEAEMFRSKTLSAEAAVVHKLQYDLYCFDVQRALSVAGAFEGRRGGPGGGGGGLKAPLNDYELETGAIDGHSLHSLLLFLFPGEVMAIPAHVAAFAVHMAAALWCAERKSGGSRSGTMGGGAGVAPAEPSVYFSLVCSAAVSSHGVSASELLEATITLLELLVLLVASVHPVLRLKESGGTAPAPGPAMAGGTPFAATQDPYSAYEFDAELLQAWSLPAPADLAWLRPLSKALAVHYHKACKYYNKSLSDTGMVSGGAQESRSLADSLSKLCTCLTKEGGSSHGGVGGGQSQEHDLGKWFEALKRMQLWLGGWVDAVQDRPVLHSLVALKMQNDGLQAPLEGSGEKDAGSLRRHPLCRRPVATTKPSGTDAAVSVDSLKMASVCNHSSGLLNTPLVTEDGEQRFINITDDSCGDSATVASAAPTPGGAETSLPDLTACLVARTELEDANCEAVWHRLKPVGSGREPEQVALLCRHWPGRRLLQREARRVERRDREAHPEATWEAAANPLYGMSVAGLEELSLLQSLHYTAPGRCHPNIIPPVMVAREDLYYGESDEVADAFSSIDGELRALSYFLLTPRVHLPLSVFLRRARRYMEQFDGRMQQVSRRSAGADESHSVGAMQQHIARVLRQLCHDLGAVIRHCCANGVLFRYAALEEDIFVTEQGRLVFGSFAGAGTTASGVNSVLFTSAAPPLQTPSSGRPELGGAHKRLRLDNSMQLQRLQSHQGTLPTPQTPGDRSRELLGAANEFMFKQALYPTTALECILGGEPSIFSSLYTMGSACAHVLSAGSVNPTVATVEAMKLEAQQRQPQKVQVGSATVREFNNRQVGHLSRYLHVSPMLGDSGMPSSGASARAVAAALADTPYTGLFPVAEIVGNRSSSKSGAHLSPFGLALSRVQWLPLLLNGARGDSVQLTGTLAALCDLVPEKRSPSCHRAPERLWRAFDSLAAECDIFDPASAPALATATAADYVEGVRAMWTELRAAETVN